MNEIRNEEIGQFTKICIPLVKQFYPRLISEIAKPFDYDIALRRKLKAVWTMEAEQDLKAWSSVTDSIQEDIQRELDKEIIFDLHQAGYSYKDKPKNDVTIQEEE